MEIHLGEDINISCYIVNVENIHSSAYVFADHGGTDLCKHFLVLEREKWGLHFRTHFS